MAPLSLTSATSAGSTVIQSVTSESFWSSLDVSLTTKHKTNILLINHLISTHSQNNKVVMKMEKKN